MASLCPLRVFFWLCIFLNFAVEENIFSGSGNLKSCTAFLFWPPPFPLGFQCIFHYYRLVLIVFVKNEYLHIY
nr:MAG TPA: hypothetical protein [Caudoviricetes sp.]